jgi:hypothetical protein
VNRSLVARECAAWIDKARQIGVVVMIQPNPHRVVAVLAGTEDGFEWFVPELEDFPIDLLESVHPFVYRAGGALVSELRVPFAVPIPAPFQVGGAANIDYPSIPTLGHLIAAASADRQFVHAIQSAHQLVPLLVGALTQIPASALPYGGFPAVSERSEVREVSQRAAGWLARTLPSPILADHPSESAIHDLVVRLLSRSTSREASPTHVPGRGARSDLGFAK